MSESDNIFPSSVDFIEEWSRKRHIPLHEGRYRFVEFAILACISTSAKLSSGLVLKGGNALRVVYQNPRSTHDLDFTVIDSEISDDGDTLRQLLNDALRWASRRYNIKAKCQSVKRKPPNPNATHPTYAVKIGYQFPADAYFSSFEGRNVSTTVRLDISFFDLVCEHAAYVIEKGHEDSSAIRVCTLEDIIAEKLRALLQQPIRNRHRWQDVFDVARTYREFKARLDFAKVNDFFFKKCKDREITPTRSSFDDTVREMAELDYEKHVKEQAHGEFIPFDEAWALVIKLVEQLNLPA